MDPDTDRRGDRHPPAVWSFPCRTCHGAGSGGTLGDMTPELVPVTVLVDRTKLAELLYMWDYGGVGLYLTEGTDRVEAMVHEVYFGARNRADLLRRLGGHAVTDAGLGTATITLEPGQTVWVVPDDQPTDLPQP